MPEVRTTLRPLDEPLQVPKHEALDLRRQGLLLEGTRAKTEEGLTRAAARQRVEEPPPPPPLPPAKRAPRPRRATAKKTAPKKTSPPQEKAEANIPTDEAVTPQDAPEAQSKEN